MIERGLAQGQTSTFVPAPGPPPPPRQTTNPPTRDNDAKPQSLAQKTERGTRDHTIASPATVLFPCLLRGSGEGGPTLFSLCTSTPRCRTRNKKKLETTQKRLLAGRPPRAARQASKKRRALFLLQGAATRAHIHPCTPPGARAPRFFRLPTPPPNRIFHQSTHHFCFFFPRFFFRAGGRGGSTAPRFLFLCPPPPP